MYVIPKPQKMDVYDKKISVKSLKINADNSEILKFAKGSGETPVNFVLDTKMKAEEYKINASEKRIEIQYADLEAAYRAFTTLKQIISQAENDEINCFLIEDYPSLKNRGYMLDISRGKIPKLSYLKNLVDILSDLKYNQLQLYMDSFVFEYKNFPEYCRDTEPLTKAEIKELSDYCKERFIELVPNQNGFGHMAAWTQKKEISHLAITDKDGKPSATLNPFLTESVELIDKIYDGFFDAFSSDKVNIGMDEPFELGLNETKEACEKYGVGKVYTDYLNKICELISKKYNKTPMFWDDIVFKHPEQLANIPKNVIVMEWGYETEQHFDRNCQRLHDKGMRFYVCSGTSMWGSFTGRTNNAILNMIMAAETGNYYGAEGFLLTEWGDGGHPQFPATSYFSLVLGGAVSWNCGDHNHEVSYNERGQLIDDCKKYLDKFIFKTENDISLADIASRMGKYYLLEDCLHFNGTELNYYLNRREELTPRKIKAFKQVLSYMNGIKEELSEAKADKNMLRELNVNCDMVILFAKILTQGTAGLQTEADKLISEYEALWKMKNHIAGMNIFTDQIKNLKW